MSKVIKGVKKVFKKVAKVVKKVAPIVLAGAAIYFTAGAAMGMLPAGATAGSALAGSMGLTGTLGGVVSGAVTQAGYGALLGGTISKLSGGSFSEGMKAGAVAGAVTGGITGAFNPLPASPGAEAAAMPSGGIPDPGTLPFDKTASTATATNAADTSWLNSEVAKQAGLESAPWQLPAGTSVPPSSGGLLSKGGWLERNQTLVGQTISGLGQGLMAKASADSEREMLEDRRRRIEDSYRGVDLGAGYRSLAPGDSGLSPSDRFSPGYYQYNPRTGRIERSNG